MDCAGSGRKIERALGELPGVRDVSLHYPDTTLAVLHGTAMPPDATGDRVVRLG
ncbi:heavy-metal-associated domain-containing protein [Aureimonas sp. SK2]|uniref:heavy-metal-associated domain-containing protein n=1 Tax=Aureimonas sp. SK2 TaxID=3015992 RepID=UPI00387E7E78